MRQNAIRLEPITVLPQTDLASHALFACEMPSSWTGRVVVWATCGSRKRFPIPARIESDAKGAVRRLIILAEIPPHYTSCTVHVITKEGAFPRCASCRINHERFIDLLFEFSDVEHDARYLSWALQVREAKTDEVLAAMTGGEFELQPLVSIVTPVFRTPPSYLRCLIESVLGQSYGKLELVLVNVSGPCPEVEAVIAEFEDDRLRVVEAPNKSIPENTNVGIEAARGDYVAFVDHDDFIEADALYHYVKVINDHPETDLLFCDEDLWDDEYEGGSFRGPKIKPGWSPDLQLLHNYVCHMLMVSRRVLDLTDRSTAETNGAQDYDLTLRAMEVAREIHHVPGVLYHWRLHSLSTAENPESKPYALKAGLKALQSHFDRMGLKAQVSYSPVKVSYRVRYEVPASQVVTLIVLGDDAGIPVRVEGLVAAGDGSVEVLSCGWKMVNDAVERASGSVVALVGDEVGLADFGWIGEASRQLMSPLVGCCAPLLVDADGFIQSAGFVFGEDDVWRYAFTGYYRGYVGALDLLEHVRNASAVPSSCAAFRRADLIGIGGFDVSLERDLATIDFCLRLEQAGMSIVVQAYEPAQVTRPLDEVADADFGRSVRERYSLMRSGDPFVSPLFDQTRESFVLAFPEERPA